MPTSAPAADGAAGPGQQRTGLVRVVVPIVYDLYFSAMLQGVAAALDEHEMELVLSPTQHEHARGVSGRPADQWRYRRGRAHPARAVERGTATPPGRPLPVRRGRPPAACRRPGPVRFSGAPFGGRSSNGALAGARAPSDRRHYGAARVGSDRRTPERLSGCAWDGRAGARRRL